MEVEFIAKSARRINILVWTSPVRNSSGNITHVMVMATNIDQVLDFQDHLSSLGLLIGSVSHGIKGLLTGLDGGLYLLDSGLSKQDSQQTKEGLDVTKQMVARIRNMVLDILFYAKDRELNREQIDVAAFAEDVAGVIEPKLEKQSIQMIKDFKQPLGTFNVDAGFLHSALVNILENAMDACTDDNLKTDHRITFVVEKLKDEILFEISDNGIGMDEKRFHKCLICFFLPRENKERVWGCLSRKESSNNMAEKSRSNPPKVREPPWQFEFLSLMGKIRMNGSGLYRNNDTKTLGSRT
jgi:signal transduction histidine kinase